MWLVWTLLAIAVSCVPQEKVNIFNLALTNLPEPSRNLEYYRTAEPVPRKYVVRLDGDAPTEAVTVIEPLLKIVNITITETFLYPRGFSMLSGTFELPLDLLRRIPYIQSIEEQFYLRAHQIQENPSWSLDRLDFKYSNTSYDGSYVFDGLAANVDVYILDSGVEQHSEFVGRLKPGFTTFGDNKDCTKHGTHVAGIVAGLNVGVAKGANIIPVKVLGCNNETTLEQLVKGINWIIDHKKKNKPDSVSIINMSIGPDGSSKTPIVSTTLDDALKAAMASKLLVVLSAGNENVDICQSSPARVEGIIVVGASDRNDRKADFSNFGSCVGVYAPGVGIFSSVPSDQYDLRFGTSQAAPHVAGIAALHIEKNPDASLEDIRRAIFGAAMPVRGSNIRIAQMVSVPAKGSSGAQKVLTRSLRNDVGNMAERSSNSGLSTDILIACIVSGVVAIALIAGLSIFVLRKKRNEKITIMTPNSPQRKMSKPVLPFYNDPAVHYYNNQKAADVNGTLKKPSPILNPYGGSSTRNGSDKSLHSRNQFRKPSASETSILLESRKPSISGSNINARGASNQARKPSASDSNLAHMQPRKPSTSSDGSTKGQLNRSRKPSLASPTKLPISSLNKTGANSTPNLHLARNQTSPTKYDDSNAYARSERKK